MIVHIFYQNGAYILSQPFTTIKDIVDGVEVDGISNAAGGPNIIPNWAGTTGNYAGKPSDYGWGLNPANSTLFATANSTTVGTSRYMDVNASSGGNRYTYLDSTYTGRLFFVRWDAPSTQNIAYFLPVTLEANTTYDFSMLHAYINNATGAKTMTVGIGQSTNPADRIASRVFTTTGTRELKRESFVFTSQQAGTYYLTLTGDYGVFSIGELSLNKNLPGSLIPNWAGIAPNNSGKPSDYEWLLDPASTTLFAVANATTVGSSRYVDVNASSGFNLHTYNGSTYVGRVLFVRWDGSNANRVYSYPVTLEANTTYNFSMLFSYFSNGSPGSSIQVGIGTTKTTGGRLFTKSFTTLCTARSLKKDEFFFTSPESGTYYLTFTGPTALYSILTASVDTISIITVCSITKESDFIYINTNFLATLLPLGIN